MTMMMLGAVQLGAAAACVVVLVPMGMAGWHLSRNKMLFFSGALFITLAVCVHLTPYFPSVSDFVTSVSSVVVFDHRISCINLVNEIDWDVKPNSSIPNDSLEFYDKRWDWSKSPKLDACDFQKLPGSDASDLLNGSWVVVADFKVKKSYPDVMVMGAGLWHMLHVTNASDYDFALRMLRSSVVSLLPFSPELSLNGPVTGSVSIKSPHLFWLGLPMLINGMLNTEEKREKMSDALWHAYDRALGDSKLLRQTGGPLLLLDIQSLTWNCGPRCTSDGMHYDGAIYEAAVQIMLNALLIESHQQL
ncbi:hypothetical protein QQP08_013172 [Theobroma cacao]|nr:hypothetical protein QQP08_013172 [Theobroma cacao]